MKPSVGYKPIGGVAGIEYRIGGCKAHCVKVAGPAGRP
jgi:hypothetical protein